MLINPKSMFNTNINHITQGLQVAYPAHSFDVTQPVTPIIFTVRDVPTQAQFNALFPANPTHGTRIFVGTMTATFNLVGIAGGVELFGIGGTITWMYSDWAPALLNNRTVALSADVVTNEIAISLNEPNYTFNFFGYAFDYK